MTENDEYCCMTRSAYDIEATEADCEFFIISQLGSLRSIDSRRFKISCSIFFSQLSPYCLKRARSGSIRLDAAFEDL